MLNSRGPKIKIRVGGGEGGGEQTFFGRVEASVPPLVKSLRMIVLKITSNLALLLAKSRERERERDTKWAVLPTHLVFYQLPVLVRLYMTFTAHQKNERFPGCLQLFVQ